MGEMTKDIKHFFGWITPKIKKLWNSGIEMKIVIVFILLMTVLLFIGGLNNMIHSSDTDNGIDIEDVIGAKSMELIDTHEFEEVDGYYQSIDDGLFKEASKYKTHVYEVVLEDGAVIEYTKNTHIQYSDRYTDDLEPVEETISYKIEGNTSDTVYSVYTDLLDAGWFIEDTDLDYSDIEYDDDTMKYTIFAQ